MFKDIIEIVVLSLIQGVSEFLPISSSAHLIIVSSLYEFKSSSLLIDVSLHLGSLLAIIFFFRKELFNIRNNHKLLLLIIIGSIPLVIVGYFLHSTGFIYLLRDIKIMTYLTDVEQDNEGQFEYVENSHFFNFFNPLKRLYFAFHLRLLLVKLKLASDFNISFLFILSLLNIL